MICTPSGSDAEYEAGMRIRTVPRISYRQLIRLSKRGTLKSTIAGWRRAKGITP